MTINDKLEALEAAIDAAAELLTKNSPRVELDAFERLLQAHSDLVTTGKWKGFNANVD